MEKEKINSNIPEDIKNVFEGKSIANQEENNLAGEGSIDSNKEKNKGDSVMDKNEVAKVVASEVDTVLKAKEEQAEIQEKISGLESAKASLTEKVEELTSLNKSLAEEKEALEKDNESLKASKAEAEENVKKTEKELDDAKAKLEEIEKEKIIASRKEKLIASKLLISDEKLQEKQMSKASNMTEEEFNDYVEELSAIAKEDEDSDSDSDSESDKGSAKASVKNVNMTDGEIFQKAIASGQSQSYSLDKEEMYSKL